MKKVLKQGAEAVIYKDKGIITKERISKGYRVSSLDEEIRAHRTKREVKSIAAAERAGVNVPNVISHTKTSINMSFIEGPRVKDILEDSTNEIATEIGKALARLHSNDIAHGDPTTSNMIWNGKLYIIDFGLSEITKSVEAKATDLYVLEESIRAAHFNILDKAWKAIIKSYKENYKDSEKVLSQLKKIKLRVRYADKT